MVNRRALKATIATCLLILTGIMIFHQSILSLSGASNVHRSIHIHNHTRHTHRHTPSSAHSGGKQASAANDGPDGSVDESSLFDKPTEAPAISACMGQDIHTFFTDAKHSFSMMIDHLDKPIMTQELVDCSQDLANIFDILSATAFSPVKSNFLKQVEVIRKKQEMDKVKYNTINSIVEEEIKLKIHLQSESATDAILWLVRSLLFISELFSNFEEQEEFNSAVNIAYSTTLRQYHGFAVKALFSMIGPVLPSKESSLASLATSPIEVEKAGYADCVYESMETYNDALLAVCRNIEEYFKSNGMIIMD